LRNVIEVRSGKSRKQENREDNEHLVFKTFTQDCRDRTNMPPKTQIRYEFYFQKAQIIKSENFDWNCIN
jgi:hypothetical protein